MSVKNKIEKPIYYYLKGSTTKKIIEDLLFEFYSSEVSEEKEIFLNLLEEPIRIYNKYNNGCFQLPKL